MIRLSCPLSVSICWSVIIYYHRNAWCSYHILFLVQDTWITEAGLPKIIVTKLNRKMICLKERHLWNQCFPAIKEAAPIGNLANDPPAILDLDLESTLQDPKLE